MADMTNTAAQASGGTPRRMVGAWWGPAVGLSALGFYATATTPRDEAGREIFFNIPAGSWAVYVFLAALMGLLTWGFVRHASLWGIGRPTPGIFRDMPSRLRNTARLGLAQDKVRRDRYAGIMHWCIMSSIVVLTLVTAQVAIEADTPLHFLYGDYYLFFSFYGDLFGVIGLIGVGMALYRRYFDPLYRFFRAKAPDDYEDLIQNTMLECVRSRERFRGDAPFRAYLFGVARHRLLHGGRHRLGDKDQLKQRRDGGGEGAVR